MPGDEPLLNPSEISQEFGHTEPILTQAVQRRAPKLPLPAATEVTVWQRFSLNLRAAPSMLKHTFMILYVWTDLWALLKFDSCVEFQSASNIMTHGSVLFRRTSEHIRTTTGSLSRVGHWRHWLATWREIPLALCWSMFACCPGGRSRHGEDHPKWEMWRPKLGGQKWIALIIHKQNGIGFDISPDRSEPRPRWTTRITHLRNQLHFP